MKNKPEYYGIVIIISTGIIGVTALIIDFWLGLRYHSVTLRILGLMILTQVVIVSHSIYGDLWM